MQTDANTHSTEGTSAVDLVKKASTDAAELVRTELALAREELHDDLARARGSAALVGVAALLGLAGLELVLGALVVKERRHPGTLALLGLGGIAGAIVLGGMALSSAPRPLDRTRHRIEEDIDTIEEKIP